MPVLGAGCRCWCCELAAQVVGTGAGCGLWCWCWVLVLGAGAGRHELARRSSALVPASDSEVITAASDSEG